MPDRWPRWPLAVAALLWLVGGALAWNGHTWPLAILGALGVLSAMIGVTAFVVARRAATSLQTQSSKVLAPPTRVDSPHARNRGRAGKRARKRR